MALKNKNRINPVFIIDKELREIINLRFDFDK